MREIHVDVSYPYDVLIGRGIVNELAELIRPICTSNRVAIVTDDIVAGQYLETVDQNLRASSFETVSFTFLNGEQSKNISTLSDILEFLAKNYIRRNDTLIALGGGVPGDITGLAAAIYTR